MDNVAVFTQLNGSTQKPFFKRWIRRRNEATDYVYTFDPQFVQFFLEHASPGERLPTVIEVVANVDDHVDYKDIASIIKEKDDGFVRENPEMDFEFNENQLDLQKMVRELAEKEIGPRAKENDEKDVFPVDVFKMMADMGLTAIGVPESYGGPEATDIERMIAIEEIAKKDGAVATILAVHGMFVQALEKYGTEEQKQRFYPRIAEEGYYTAFALTEPCAGSDPASAKTTAVYDPATDEYVLNGNKCFITGGARADAILVFALTDPSLGAKGMSAFIVEKGMKGFSTGKIEDKNGYQMLRNSRALLR